MDEHRCGGRSLEVRVRNWCTWRGPGEEVKELVNVAEKVTECLCSPLTKMQCLRQRQGPGVWDMVAGRSCQCICSPFHLLWAALCHLAIPAGLGRAAQSCRSQEGLQRMPPHLGFLIL